MNITDILISAINQPEAQMFVVLLLWATTFIARYVRVWMLDVSDFLKKKNKSRSNRYYIASICVFLLEVLTYSAIGNVIVEQTTMLTAAVINIFFYLFVWTNFDYIEQYSRKVTGKRMLNKSSKYYYQQLDEVAEYSKVYRFMASNRLITGHRPELRP
tara:strand:+ start:789 stop:1262 length:474 start_codon:yes stop_codon:yes gene_type:complete